MLRKRNRDQLTHRRNTHSIRLPPLLTPIIQRIPQHLARDLLLLTTPRLEKAYVQCRELGAVQPGGIPWRVHGEEDVCFILD